MVYSIRPATHADEPAVSRICLLTGEKGDSAEGLYDHPELIGLVYATPYLHMKNTFGYVLTTTDPEPASPIQSITETQNQTQNQLAGLGSAPLVPPPSNATDVVSTPSAEIPLPNVNLSKSPDSSSQERVIGYILGAPDTRAYEAELREKWWPHQRTRFPVSSLTPDSLPGDVRLYNHFVNPDTSPEEIVALAPAHMHIDILPEAQRLGWGRKLIDVAVNHLKEKEGADALFLGIDSRNDRARKFYKHLGYQLIPTPSGENYLLKFEDWVSPRAGNAKTEPHDVAR